MLVAIRDFKYTLCFVITTFLLCIKLSLTCFYFIFKNLTRSEFPTLSSQGRSSMMKDQSPANRQKSQAGKLPVSSAALANQSGKGKAEASNKQTGTVADFCSCFEVSLC